MSIHETSCSASCSADAGLFWGGLLVLFGGCALLVELGVFPHVELWKLWPLILVWIGLLRLTEQGKRWGGLLWIAIGALAQALYFELLPFEWRFVWPALVVVLGLKLLVRGGPRKRRGAPPRTAAPGGDLATRIVLGGKQEHFDGRDFSGGVVQCLLGGYELDLRGSEMVGGEARLDLDVTLGGIEIRVPRSWRVELEGSPVLGGIENETNPGPDADRRLVISCRAVLSGVEIKN